MAEEQGRQRDGMTDAEIAKARADEKRLLAEAQKAKAESRRVEAETAAITGPDSKERLKAEAAKLQAEADKATAESKMIEAEATKVVADEKRLKAEAAKLQAEADKATAECKIIEAEVSRTELHKAKLEAETEKYKADVKRIKKDEKKLEKQRDWAKEDSAQMQGFAKCSSGVREFVRNSLLDIMAGVDDAAAVGKTRELTEGLVRYLPTVTAIGAGESGEHGAERVEFDLAVTVVVTKDDVDHKKVGGELKIAPTFFPVRAGISGQYESTQGITNSSEYANRIRFSVPIVYAIQNDPLDYE